MWIREGKNRIRDQGWKKIRIRDPGYTSRIRNTRSLPTAAVLLLHVAIGFAC
jgi:hypothetical protein